MPRPQPVLAAIEIRGRTYPDRGYCYESGYDGPIIHTVYCLRGPADTGFSSRACIQRGQDGAKIQAQREAEAEARRFTPPEYRTPSGKPLQRKAGPVITPAQGQTVEVVALRGRPRTPDGTTEWTTWETYTQTDPAYQGLRTAKFLHQVPKVLTKKEAAKIVAEFTERLPHYEFQIVHAHLVVNETVLA